MNRPEVTCDLAFTGTLVEHATARVKRADGEGHMLPVLCFEVETDSSTRGRCMVEQLFPQGHEAQCHAAAARLRAGMRVTFHAPAVGITLIARNCTRVHVHTAEERAGQAVAA
jgi:hypothetical protein